MVEIEGATVSSSPPLLINYHFQSLVVLFEPLAFIPPLTVITFARKPEIFFKVKDSIIVVELFGTEFKFFGVNSAKKLSLAVSFQVEISEPSVHT